MKLIDFWVGGKPITQGSKTVLTRGKKVWQVDRNNMKTKKMPANRLKDWRRKVEMAAMAEMYATDTEMARSNVKVMAKFRMRRPKSHWLKSGKVRAGASDVPVGDLDKLFRAVGDAMSGLVYRDDALINKIVATKTYVTQHGAEGVQITVMFGGE